MTLSSPEQDDLDWSAVPESATDAGQQFWQRLWDDYIAGSHAMHMFQDMFEVLRQAGSVPVRLRATADATERGVELDEEAFKTHVRAMSLDEIVLPGHRSLLGRVRDMQRPTETMLFEVLLCRSVDTFLSYISDIMAEIFIARPETLRSEETVTVQQVLAHQDLSEFIAWVADRRINSLSYKGLGDIARFIGDRFGLDLVPDPDHAQRLTELIAVRNLIVHRRGVIDQRFVDAVGTSFGTVGDRVKASSFWASRHADVPSAVVRAFDPAAARKFNLSTTPVKVKQYWPEPERESSAP